MKPLLIAVLLAIMQAPPPAPGKAPDQAAGGRQDVESQGDKHKAAPAPTMPIHKDDSTPRAEPESGKVASKDAEQPIRITKLPPVSVAKDWSDRVYWIFSGLLVVVGFLQVWLLLGTLRAIRRQAELMEIQTGILGKSVRAAEDNAAAREGAEAASKNAEFSKLNAEATKENAAAAKASAEAASKAVDLQRAAQQQWVVFENWRVLRRVVGEKYEMVIQFDIVNASSWPLSLLHSAIRVGSRLKGQELWRIYRILLAPRVPYTVDIRVPLTAEQDQSYLSGNLVLSVAGLFY